MVKKIWFGLWCCSLLWLVSCVNSEEKVILGGGHQFVLEADEEIVPKSEEQLIFFESCCNQFDDVQVPLYQFVKGNGYLIYIGIVTEMGIGEYSNLLESNFKTNFRDQTESSDLLMYSVMDENQICHNYYLVELDEKSRFLVLMSTENNEFCQESFSEPWLRNRIKEL